jgi:hypothetical protein
MLEVLGCVLLAGAAKASYELVKPSQAYRKVFGILEEQAGLAWRVMQVHSVHACLQCGGWMDGLVIVAALRILQYLCLDLDTTCRGCWLVGGRYAVCQLMELSCRVPSAVCIGRRG